jgi:hypothetical protein
MNNKNELGFLVTSEKFYALYAIGFVQIVKIFGVLSNIVNLIVFSDPRFKDQIYIYLRAHSIADIFYLACNFVGEYAFVKYYLPNTFTRSYLMQLAGLYLTNYFTSCLALFNILIELIVSFQRLLILKNVESCKCMRSTTPYLILTLFFIFSLIVYSQEVIFWLVLPIETISMNSKNETIVGTLYDIGVNSFGINYIDIYDNLALSVQIFRGPVCLVLMIVLNSITWYQFKQYIAKKAKMKGGK